jgi:hypothetical protein
MQKYVIAVEFVNESWHKDDEDIVTPKIKKIKEV